MSKYIQAYFLTPSKEDSSVGNGKENPPARWDWLEDELCKRFGGFTKLPGICKGKWVDSSGVVIVDDSYQWLVAIPKSNLNKMRIFIKEVAFKFRQQCIYFSHQGKVEFIEYSKNREEIGISVFIKTYVSHLIRGV